MLSIPEAISNSSFGEVRAKNVRQHCGRQRACRTLLLVGKCTTLFSPRSSFKMVISRDARRAAKQKGTPQPPKTITKPIGGEKNGKTRDVIVNKGPKWYPADDVKIPFPSRRRVHNPTKLRSSIKPGCVLILLAGARAGSRVVFLKQLPSGFLLVTGPYAVNNVPLRRVDQAYVIATSAIVDISGVDLTKYDDSYFKKDKVSQKKDVMETDEPTNGEKKSDALPAERATEQKAVDSAIVAAIEKVPLMTSYMKCRFSLKKGQYPHELKF